MASHMAKTVEVDRLEAIMEDFHNFLLWEACKAEGEALNLLGNLTCYIVFLPHPSRGCLAWGRYRSRGGSGGGGGGGGDSGVRLPLHAFELKCVLPSNSRPFILGLLTVDLEDLQVLLLREASATIRSRGGLRGAIKKRRPEAKSLASWRLWLLEG